MSAAEKYAAEMRAELDKFQRATWAYDRRTQVYVEKHHGDPIADVDAQTDRERVRAGGMASWHRDCAVMWGIAALVEYCREGT